jgi:hypothetical protein
MSQFEHFVSATRKAMSWRREEARPRIFSVARARGRCSSDFFPLFQAGLMDAETLFWIGMEKAAIGRLQRELEF